MSDEWNTYRTRFLVRARQLTEPLTFVDSLGRQHQGKAGDYVVEFCKGMLRVASREIFEDVYVMMKAQTGEIALPANSAKPPSAGRNLRI